MQAYEQTADMKIINHISSDEEEVDVVVIEVIIIFTIKFVFFLFFVFFIFFKYVPVCNTRTINRTRTYVQENKEIFIKKAL